MRKLQLKKIMEEKGVSQGQLSRRADVPQEIIRRMLRDPYYNATITTLMKIADYLEVGLDDLYANDESSEVSE